MQNDNGNIFCLPFFDSGLFKIRIFDEKCDKIDELENINEKLGISFEQNYLINFDVPSISVNFNDNESIYVNLFDNVENVHWFFQYNFITHEIAHILSYKMCCSEENILMTSLLDSQNHQLHVLYRKGQCLTIDLRKMIDHKDNLDLIFYK